MQATARDYVEQLNRSFFDGELGPGIVDRLAVLPVDRADVRAFVERMFREMRRWRFPATEVSLMHAELLGSLLSRILPGTWQGRVPPITVAGRHRKLDELVRLIAQSDGLGHTLIDIACGFPPMTTIDSAEALPGWQITGIDRALPAYLVTDHDNNYAVFDREGRATYFQPTEATVERWTALLEDWDASRRRFEELLQTLLAARAAGADRVEKDGASLEIDPVRAFERPGLRFAASNLEEHYCGRPGIAACLVHRGEQAREAGDVPGDNGEHHAVHWALRNRVGDHDRVHEHRRAGLDRPRRGQRPDCGGADRNGTGPVRRDSSGLFLQPLHGEGEDLRVRDGRFRTGVPEHF